MIAVMSESEQVAGKVGQSQMLQIISWTLLATFICFWLLGGQVYQAFWSVNFFPPPPP